MKWISPAWISPALVLALAPAGIATGQSTTSGFDGLPTGPIAELLPDTGTRSFRPGVVNPKDLARPPATNPLPGDPSPLSVGNSNRSSLINEPVPFSEVPQIQKDMYSLEDTFTLPRTPAVSKEYIQQQPKQLSAVADTYSTQTATPVVSQPMQPDVATSPVAAGVCACGSNELAPDNCQCDSCQGQLPQMDFSDGCSSCEQIVQDGFNECGSCDSCETVVSNAGCSGGGACGSCGGGSCGGGSCGGGSCGGGSCGGFEMSCSNCEVIGGPDTYFQTEERGFADEDVAQRDVKLGPIARHFKKHHQRKQVRHQGNQLVGVGEGNFDGFVQGAAAGAAGAGQLNAGNNVYQPAVANNIGNPNDTHTNTLFSVSGVFLNRNTLDLPLSSELLPFGAAPTRFLRTGDADFDDIGGFDASLVRRRATGKGFELRYLSLNPGEESAQFAGNPVTLIRDFGQIGQIGGLTHEQAFNLADVHEVRRDMSIQNAEFNLLRMGRQAQTRRGRQAIFEYLLGFRYFKFDESLNYSAFGIRPNIFSGGDISRADFSAEVENELYGAQFGGRSEFSLSQRLGLLVGLKAGIFQNNFSASQRASVTGLDGQQRIAQVLNDPNQGTPFNLSGEDEDYTLLGEIDLGLTYRVTSSLRLRGGYKAIFVDDVAFADSQGTSNFNDIAANSIPRANEDLVLYGGYFGVDLAF